MISNVHKLSVRSPFTPPFGVWPKAALVAIAYFIGAETAFLVGTLSDDIFAPFWPPNVILFCALLLAPRRHWWIYIALTFGVAFAFACPLFLFMRERRLVSSRS